MTEPPTTPVARLLGPDAARGGPFALLGIEPLRCSDEAVISALQERLDTLARHPESETPEADEVRLALHASAAQLLDPVVRQHLVQRWLSHGPDAVADAPANGARSGPGVARSMPTGLEHEALLTLAQYGGWNERALRRLASLAQARGMSSREVAETVRRLSTRPAGVGAAGAAAGAKGSASVPRAAPIEDTTEGSDASVDREPPGWASPEPTANSGSLARQALITAGIFAVLAMIVTAALVLFPPRGSGTAAPEGATTAEAGTPDPSEAETAPADADEAEQPVAADTSASPGDEAAPEQPRLRDPAQILRELRAATDIARSDPEAGLARFSGPVDSFASQWPRFEVGARRAATDAIVGFFHAAGSAGGVRERALEIVVAHGEPLADPAAVLKEEHVAPVVWTAGVLARLDRERELSRLFAASVDASIASLLGDQTSVSLQEFEPGAIAAAQRLPMRIISQRPEADERSARRAFTRWLETVEALTTDDAAHAERLITSAIEQIMVEGPEPTASESVFAALQTLGGSARWSADGSARERLLAWFVSERVSTADLRVLTGAIAMRSRAAGVDPTMVLSGMATRDERLKLRDRYAGSWGLSEESERSDVVAEWRAEADDRFSGAESAADWLAEASRTAWLNAAAQAIWSGDLRTAERLTRAADDDARRALALAGTAADSRIHYIEGSGTDGDWARGFLAAGRSIPLRLEALEALKDRSQLGPVDAETLAEAAVFGTPIEVKFEAQKRAEQFTESPAMVNGLLEVLPRAPQIRSVSEMIEHFTRTRLPAVNAPEWEMEARRALVERLLAMVASKGSLAAVDALSASIADAYRRRAGLVSLGADAQSPIANEDAPQVALLGARASFDQWRNAAVDIGPNPNAPLSIEAVDRRRAGRHSLARGPVQLFVAEQIGIVELAAYIVSAERPGAVPDIRTVLAELAEARRSATHVFQQVRAAEHALLQLWKIRLAAGGGAS